MRMKMMKRMVCILLSFLLVIPGLFFTSGTEAHAGEHAPLAAGTYIVELDEWNYDESYETDNHLLPRTIGGGSSAVNVAPRAVLTSRGDGSYYLTMRVYGYSKWKVLKFMSQAHYAALDGSHRCGTDWKDYDGNEMEGYQDEAGTRGDAAANPYWETISNEGAAVDPEQDMGCVTVMLTDLDALFAIGGYTSFDVKGRLSKYLGRQIYSLNTESISGAMELMMPSEDGVYLDMRRYGKYSEYDTNDLLPDLFDQPVACTTQDYQTYTARCRVRGDASETVTGIQLLESAELGTSVSYFTTYTSLRTGAVFGENIYDPETKEFTLTFQSSGTMSLLTGVDALIRTEEHPEGFRTVLMLSSVPPEYVTFLDDKTGCSYTSRDRFVRGKQLVFSSGEDCNATAVKAIRQIADGDNWRAYTFRLQDEEGNGFFPQKGGVARVPIPAGWDLDNIFIAVHYSNGLVVNSDQKDGSYWKEHVKFVTENGTRYVEYTTINSNWAQEGTISMCQVMKEADLKSALSEDGVYTADAKFIKAGGEGNLSMANDALDPKVTVQVSGGQKTIYMNFHAMHLMEDVDAYVGAIWNKDSSDTAVLDYETDRDGKLLDNAGFDAVTEFGCVKSVRMNLADDTMSDNKYTLKVIPPAMAGSMTYEEAMQNAIDVDLKLYNVKKADAPVQIRQEQKAVLRRAIDHAKHYDKASYSEASYANLEMTLQIAEDFYKGLAGTDADTDEASSTQIALFVQYLDMYIGELEENDTLAEARSALREAVEEAKKTERGSKTESAYDALQSAIARAEAEAGRAGATTDSLEEARRLLEQAVEAFLQSEEESELNPADLADGSYTAQVTVLKAGNSADISMSDKALVKPVTITVKDGSYTMHCEYQGITIPLGGKEFFGYMKDLSYWDGAQYVPVTVDSEYDVTDSFNDTDGDGKAEYYYPHQMSFPLVNKDKGDDKNGCIRMQVFVPIMEAISPGSGTQEALFKIDWTSLKKKGEETAKAAFGSDGTELTAGSYTVPVSLRRDTDHNTDSMAAAALPATGILTVDQDGAAVLRLDPLGEVEVMKIRDMAYDWRVYQENSTDSAAVEANVLQTIAYEGSAYAQTGRTRTMPAAIAFGIPAAMTREDGVYLGMTVDAMGSSPDAWLAIDYKNAVPEGNEIEFTYTGTAKVTQFGKYDVSAEVKVDAAGRIRSVAVTGGNYAGSYADINRAKLEEAIAGMTGQFTEKDSRSAEDIMAVDTVSGATYSSEAIRDAVMNALRLSYEKELADPPADGLSAGTYTIDIGYYSDEVKHSLVEEKTRQATLTADENGRITLDTDLINGTSKEPLYILDFAGYYADNDRTKALKTDAVVKTEPSDYSDRYFAQGTEVVTHVSFPLEGALANVYNTNMRLYVPAMNNLNGTLSGIEFENGAFYVDCFAELHWDTLKKVSDDPGGTEQIADGVYEVPVQAMHAIKDTASMMNRSINGNALVSVENGKASCKIFFRPIEVLGEHGHLLELWSYASDVNSGKIPAAAGNFYTEEDQTYPGSFSFVRTKAGEKQIFVRVRVDAMEGAEQDARLVFDWDNATEQTLDTGDLENAIAVATEHLAVAAQNPELYTEDSTAALQKAVAQASEIIKDRLLTQAIVDQATADLTEAIEGLTEQEADRTPLAEAVAAAKKVSADAYTPVSYQALADEIAAAEAVLAKEKVTGAEIAAAVKALEAKQAGLIRRADFTALQKAYDDAAAIGGENLPGWSALRTALENAGKVLADANTTQAQVDDQINALKAAVENLGAGIDKSVLEERLKQAKAIDTTGYTDESAGALAAAIAAAEEVWRDTNASQQDIEKQIALLEHAAKALIRKAEEGVVYDGVYQISGWLYHASADQYSMGNAALAKPLQLIVKDGEATLRMEFKPLTTSLGTTQFTGYLAQLNYFPDWTGGDTGYQAPVNETPVAAAVEEPYTDTYDSFNDPETGTDANVKGKLYPHIVRMPVALGDDEVWVQVYVPVMEAISTGVGLQFAKLQLDWNTLEQLSGTETDRHALESALEEAKRLRDSLKEGMYGYSEKNLNALSGAIANGQAVAENPNVDQSAVDAAADALLAAMNLFREEPVQTDKTALEKAIAAADTYLKDKDSGFSEASLAVLSAARDGAAELYADANATQDQVNAAVAAIDSAIRGLRKDAADRSALKEMLDTAADMLKHGDVYSDAERELLQDAYDAAQAVYEDETASQETVDAQARLLRSLIKSVRPAAQSSVEKAGLHDVLVAAANMLGRDSTWTWKSRQALKKAIRAAEQIFDDPAATQAEVNAAANEVVDAMLDLELREGIFAKPDDGGNGNQNNNGGGNQNNNGGGNQNNGGGQNDGKDILDIRNLPDGVYTLTGHMVKVNKTDASMSDNAINHNIRLTVKDGKYYITMDFNGLTVGNQLGYLGQLKYFTTGYTTDRYGAPQGSVADVTVDTYQLSADGSRVSDNYGTDYPDLVTFEMIPEALEDGYVPLQVFVPIMEAISAGSGTQPVWLALDWSSIKAAENGGNTNGNGAGSGGTNGQGGASVNRMANTLPQNTDAGNGSALNGSTLNTGTPGSTSGTGSRLNGGTSSLGSSGSGLPAASTLSSSGGLTGISGTKTGDDPMMAVWIVIMAMAAAAAVLLLAERKTAV